MKNLPTHLYAVKINQGISLVAKDGDKLLWDGGETGSWMCWPKGLKIVKKYQYPDSHKEDAWDKLWAQFYHDFPLQPVEEMEQSDGWLAPNGKFYTCGWMEHDGISEHLTVQYYNSFDGTQLLDAKGWGRVHFGGEIFFEEDPTQAQLDTMFDFSKVGNWKDTMLDNIERAKI